MATIAELRADLAEAQAALTRVREAQSVGSDGTSMTRSSLKDALADRDQAQERLDSALGGAKRMFARGRTRFLGGI